MCKHSKTFMPALNIQETSMRHFLGNRILSGSQAVSIGHWSITNMGEYSDRTGLPMSISGIFTLHGLSPVPLMVLY